MKNKLNFKYLFFDLIILMPIIFTLCYTIKASLANKVVILEMLLAYGALNINYLKNHKKVSFIIFNFLTFMYIIYTIYISDILSIIHINFYSFLLMFIIFSLFSDNNYRNDFFEYFNTKIKINYFSFCLFIAIILFYCLFKNGIKLEYGSSIPILYGPFNVSHILAYILLIYYSIFSLFGKKLKLAFLIKFICIVGIILTGVRSAAIGAIILIVYDFLSIKGLNKKTVIVIIFSILFIYLYYNTNIFINNPLVNKTMIASKSGSITNGREIFRDVALDYYKNSTTSVQKVIGITMDGVLKVMHNSIGLSIHTHNDYVNLLLGYGIIGLILMIYSQIKMGRICKNILSFIFFELFIFVLAYYNGFAMYAMLSSSFPIILCLFEKKLDK